MDLLGYFRQKIQKQDLFVLIKLFQNLKVVCAGHVAGLGVPIGKRDFKFIEYIQLSIQFRIYLETFQNKFPKGCY